MGTLKHAGLGTLLIGSVYCPDGGTLAPDSPADHTLRGCFDALIGQNLPYVLGGDFNKPPQAIREWLAINGIAANVVHTNTATFERAGNHSTIDYFVISEDIVPFASPPYIHQQQLIPEHSPVCLPLDKAAGDVTVTVLVAPRQDPDPVIGPHLDHDITGTWADYRQAAKGGPDHQPSTPNIDEWMAAANRERDSLFQPQSQAGALRTRKLTLSQATRPKESTHPCTGK